MKLPETFKFIADDGGYVYSASLMDDLYEVSWTEGEYPKSISYPQGNVSRFVSDGSWRILPESFKDILAVTDALAILINEKRDATELRYEELAALKLARALITRLLDDRG
jgi:hypothetical protein